MEQLRKRTLGYFTATRRVASMRLTEVVKISSAPSATASSTTASAPWGSTS